MVSGFESISGRAQVMRRLQIFSLSKEGKEENDGSAEDSYAAWQAEISSVCKRCQKNFTRGGKVACGYMKV